MKLALGTAQFGLNYGIANQVGKVCHKEAKSIIDLAKSTGIDMLDTAIAYGESEVSLGAVGVDGFKVITKLPAIPDDVVDVSYWVNNQIEASLKRLNIKSLYAVLLHRSEQLINTKGDELSKALKQLKVDGLAQKIGVSIYSPFELKSLMTSCQIDIVQAPFNIIDQRLLTSGWLQKLHDAGVEIHTRSAFLQGLLLMPTQSIPLKFKRWNYLWERWQDWHKNNNFLAMEACLNFALSFSEINRVVVGVDNSNQLHELIRASKVSNINLPSNMACTDDDLVNPSNWSLLDDCQ